MRFLVNTDILQCDSCFHNPLALWVRTSSMLQSWVLGRAAVSLVTNELWLLLPGFAITIAARWIWFFPQESDGTALQCWACSAFPEMPFPSACKPKALLWAGFLSCPCLRTEEHFFFHWGDSSPPESLFLKRCSLHLPVKLRSLSTYTFF